MKLSRLLSAMGGKRTLAGRLTCFVSAVALALSFSPCSTVDCPLPDGWLLATAMKPSPVPYTPLPVIYVEETSAGVWSWQRGSVSYEELLRNLALFRSLDPRPVLLFKFADGKDCSRLNALRTAIAAAANCSPDYTPCVQGSIEEYRLARDEPR